MGETENREQRSLGKHKKLTVVLTLAESYVPTAAISATLTKRKQRVLSRGASVNYFNIMNQKQLKANIKENLSDFTINNNSSILNLRI